MLLCCCDRLDEIKFISMDHEVHLEALPKLKEQLRADVNEGIAQLEAGKGLDGNEVLASLMLRAKAMNSVAEIEFRRENLASPVVQQLIEALNAELESIYPEDGANFFRLSPEEVAEGRGAFLVAYLDDKPVGCGAIRLNEPDLAEIKRMYVDPTVRGRRVGRRIVDALEVQARQLGATRIVLETGPRQPDAIAMYAHAGFSKIPLYGEYIGSPFSVCMAKDL
jgi:GNAT superfamily N-acetyltransferase